MKGARGEAAIAVSKPKNGPAELSRTLENRMSRKASPRAKLADEDELTGGQVNPIRHTHRQLHADFPAEIVRRLKDAVENHEARAMRERISQTKVPPLSTLQFRAGQGFSPGAVTQNPLTEKLDILAVRNLLHA
jgi:hypothetical protein